MPALWYKPVHNQDILALPISTLGKLLHTFLPFRRKVVMENIQQVFGNQLQKTAQKHLAQAFYSHLATSIKEAFLLRFMKEATLKAQVEIKGHEYMLQVAAQKKGVLVLTGHLGNWEFAPLGGILHFTEFKDRFHFIRRTLGSKRLEKILFKRYYEAGLQVIPKKNSLLQVCNALEQNHAVIFVLDQHASTTNKDGIAVEFFGKKAGTYRSLATIARHTGIPVIPAASYRLPTGRHILEFHPPLYWEEHPHPQEALYHNTLRYNQALEKLILAHPEQWIWLHKRWKLPS